jgi:ketosteroid isomerase-like protein
MDLLEKGDAPEIVKEGLLAPDVKWYPAAELTGVAETYEGPEGFVELQRAWTENFDWSSSTGELREVDDLVLASGRQTAHGKGSGVPVEMEFAMLSTVRDTAISEVRLYLSEADALKAAGLSG